ncbi:MAG TPA: hypothetical protein PKM41_06530 [Deltaproteobacteria bacterium]|nr:hypothetical protein [Deltaproteobacteria bacterium]HOI06765.1 hypothetical protein [Deltaproteobacteria bacterium]
MKKALLSLFLCLALASLPCASLADDLALTKPSRILTTSLLGLSFGILVGAAIAGFSSGSNTAPILIAGGIGLALGFALAAATPTEEVEEVSVLEAQEGPTALIPSGRPEAGAGAFR